MIAPNPQGTSSAASLSVRQTFQQMLNGPPDPPFRAARSSCLPIRPSANDSDAVTAAGTHRSKWRYKSRNVAPLVTRTVQNTRKQAQASSRFLRSLAVTRRNETTRCNSRHTANSSSVIALPPGAHALRLAKNFRRNLLLIVHAAGPDAAAGLLQQRPQPTVGQLSVGGKIGPRR